MMVTIRQVREKSIGGGGINGGGGGVTLVIGRTAAGE